MSHHCGLVIGSVAPRDEGTWKCKMDLTDEYSNIHKFKKVIDLKVRKNRQRRRRKEIKERIFRKY